MNNVEVPDMGLNKYTVGSKKNDVGRKKRTCDVDVPEAARKLAFGVVSDVKLPGVLLIANMNNFDVPVLVLNNNTMGRKKNIFDVDLLVLGIHDTEVPYVGLKNNIYDVEVPAVGMRNNMSPTAKKRKLTDEEKKENKNLQMISKFLRKQEYHIRIKEKPETPERETVSTISGYHT